jgi:hypothetical protein
MTFCFFDGIKGSLVATSNIFLKLCLKEIFELILKIINFIL